MNLFSNGLRINLSRAGLLLILALSSFNCNSTTNSNRSAGPESTDGPVPVYGYQIVKVRPHDPDAFTQGLEIRDGKFFESTGEVGRSSLRVVDPETGDVQKKVQVPPPFFAEGLSTLKGKLYQLTWQHQVGFIYEFIDPDSFQVTKTIAVFDGKQPVNELNELEYINGELYANVWHADRVAIINPDSGRVKAWLDLRGLLQPGDVQDEEAVLNGIAYDAASDRLFVTGKLWPKMFEIRIKK
jgi:glutamine cyclotransferase